MLDEPTPIAKHFFVSYPRTDREFADKLVNSIRWAGLKTWVDDESIDPGTRDWERSIRDGVNDAFAIILICSPATIETQFVQAEIRLAQKLGRPIFPVWASGDDWVDCIPLGIINHQYVDCRENSFDDGVERLLAKLKELVTEDLPTLFVVETLNDCPPSFQPIIVTKNDGDALDLFTAGHVVEWEHGFGDPFRDNLQVIAVNLAAFDSLEDLLNGLYTRYLHQRYTEYSYGRDWVLARPSTYVSLLALPWQWLQHRRARLLVDSVADYFERSTPLSAFRFNRGNWAVVDKDFDRAYGLVTSSERVAEQVFNAHPKSLSFRLREWHGAANKLSNSSATIRSLDDVAFDDYKHTFIIAPRRSRESLESQVLIVDDSNDR